MSALGRYIRLLIITRLCVAVFFQLLDLSLVVVGADVWYVDAGKSCGCYSGCYVSYPSLSLSLCL